MVPPPRLREGDRVLLGGGYDPDPEWLRGVDVGLQGTVESFYRRWLTPDLMVIRLDDELVTPKARGRFVSLKLAYAGEGWDNPTRVHVFLSPQPPSRLLGRLRPGTWVESHGGVRPLPSAQ